MYYEPWLGLINSISLNEEINKMTDDFRSSLKFIGINETEIIII